MAIQSVQGPTPVVVAAPTAPTDKTNFTGSEEASKKGTGLGLPILAGLAVSGVTYGLGTKPSAEGLLKLKDTVAVDKFVAAATKKAEKITDAAKKADATDAIGTVKTELGKVLAATGEGIDTAKTAAKTALEAVIEKLPKVSSGKTATIYGGIALVGTFLLAKLMGGGKKEEA